MQPENNQDHLFFGMDDYVQGITHALSEHLSDEQAEEPLAIGVFGAWGSGKTRVLRAVESGFQHTLSKTGGSGGAVPTIPVWFNPWRFEAEEHLIIPLLKTTEQTLRKQSDLIEPLAETFKSKALGLADTAIALGAGIKGKFSVGGVGLDYDVSKMLAEDARRKGGRNPKRFRSLHGRKRDEDAFNHSKDYQSIYFDINHYLRQITRPDEEEHGAINLVFLIDDLDRCLPDKAVQVLESIKLFLDIPGCAFVLGMDEEVVDRGIAYRYKEYSKQSQEDENHCPITGHEYLEKIIHLPFHLPPLNAKQVREFLLFRYADLFAKPVPDSDMEKEKRSSLLEKLERTKQEEYKTRLLELYVDAVPSVPRKLIRACELLRMNLRITRERGWRHENQTIFVITLAKLVLLQLFAPDLYRAGRKMYTFLSQMEQWVQEDEWGSDAHLQGKWEKSGESKLSDGILERRYKPVIEAWIAARNNRSGFDPDKLVKSSHLPCDSNLKHYYLLLDDTSATASIAMPTMQVEAKARNLDELESRVGTVGARATRTMQQETKGKKTEALQTASTRMTPPDLEERAVPDEPQLFLDSLFSGDALQIREAFEQEKARLQGYALAPDIFRRLLRRCEKQPEVIDVNWIKALEPYLSYSQFRQLYVSTGILDRLAREVNENASH